MTWSTRYLSGFTGSNGALLVFADDTPTRLATDGRYRTQAAASGARTSRSTSSGACGDHLVKQAFAAGARRVGFESAFSPSTVSYR